MVAEFRPKAYQTSARTQLVKPGPTCNSELVAITINYIISIL